MRKLILLGTTLVVLFASSHALASVGTDQYCDPFDGCGVKEAPAKLSKKQVLSHRSGSSAITNMYQQATSSKGTFLTVQPVAVLSNAQISREHILADAREVLSAAGLSSIAATF